MTKTESIYMYIYMQIEELWGVVSIYESVEAISGNMVT